MDASPTLSLLVVVLAAATPLSAQLTVGLIGGTVRYENVSTSSSLSLNPDLLVNQPHFLFDANASASDATGDTRVVQGGITFFGVTPPLAGPLHLTALLQAQGIKPDGLASSSSALAFGEIAVAKAGRGLAVGIGGANGTLE